jgi:hypothetical protein
MKTTPIILRLIEAAPILGGRVAGAADFNEEVEAVRLGLPCAFVMRSSGEASDATTLGEVIQMLTEEFAIVLAIDNSVSTTGQPAEDNLAPVYEEVMEALLGWIDNNGTHNSLTFVRDDHVGFDRSRLWHQMLFRTQSTISSLDGMS